MFENLAGSEFSLEDWGDWSLLLVNYRAPTLLEIAVLLYPCWTCRRHLWVTPHGMSLNFNILWLDMLETWETLWVYTWDIRITLIFTD